MNRNHSTDTIWRPVQGWVSGQRTGATVPRPVTRATATPLDGAQVGYDPADPLAVVLRLGPVEWLVCRDMLAGALHGPEGLPGGDIRMRPDGEELRVTLSSPTGVATIWIAQRAIRSLLVRSYALVPSGTEADWIDWDLLLLPGEAA